MGFYNLMMFGRLSLYNFFQSEWLQSKIEFWPLHPSLLLLPCGIFTTILDSWVFTLRQSLFSTCLSPSVYALPSIPISTLANASVCHIHFLPTQRDQVHSHHGIPLILNLIVPLTQALYFKKKFCMQIPRLPLRYSHFSRHNQRNLSEFKI